MASMWPNSPVVWLWTDWKPCHTSRSRQLWHLTVTTGSNKVATQIDSISEIPTRIMGTDKLFGKAGASNSTGVADSACCDEDSGNSRVSAGTSTGGTSTWGTSTGVVNGSSLQPWAQFHSVGILHSFEP